MTTKLKLKLLIKSPQFYRYIKEEPIYELLEKQIVK